VKYKHVVAGTNSRLDTIQAAILRVKLRHLDAWNAARQKHAAAYDLLLAGGPYVLPRVAAHRTHIFHLYVIEMDNRRQVQEFLSARGIATGIHYPIPIHMQEACKELGYSYGDFPETEAAANRILSLPMYPELTEQQRACVASDLLESSRKPSTETIRETTT
jgi:dTDP-4-amino-4,6-dideoxygalactose transaminase